MIVKKRAAKMGTMSLLITLILAFSLTSVSYASSGSMQLSSSLFSRALEFIKLIIFGEITGFSVADGQGGSVAEDGGYYLPCTNDCSYGEKECFTDDYSQTCANYDSDTCYEWPTYQYDFTYCPNKCDYGTGDCCVPDCSCADILCHDDSCSDGCIGTCTGVLGGCPDPSTVDCGDAVVDPNACDTCTGTGTNCPAGESCDTGACVPDVVDSGLRVYDGIQAVAIAAEPSGTLTSPLRIRRADGTYGLVLVDPLDSSASGLMIKTSSGTKALRKYP